MAYTVPEGSVIHELKLPLNEGGVPAVLHLTQFDTTIPILAVSLWANDKQWIPQASASANVRMRKPDGKHVYDPCLGFSDDRKIIYVAVTAQMTAAAGKGEAIVEITDGSGVIGSGRIMLFIERNPVSDDAYESSDEYKSFKELIADAEKAAKAASASADAAAESQKASSASENNAKKYAENADASASTAAGAASAAGGSATAAAGSAAAAEANKNATGELVTRAEAAAEDAGASAEAAKASADKAKAIVGFDPDSKQDKLTFPLPIEAGGTGNETGTAQYFESHLLKDEDLNDCKTTGFYYSAGNNTVANKPDNTNHFGLIVLRTASSYYIQLFVTNNSENERLFIRHFNGSTWFDWVELYTTQKLAEEHLEVKLTNSAVYPANDSQKTVDLKTKRASTNYTVDARITGVTLPDAESTALDKGDTAGAAGHIVISDKATNGFKVAYTGAARGATVELTVRGGM